MVNKKASLRVSHELSKYLRYLHQDQNLLIRSLFPRYPQFSLPAFWRNATKRTEVHTKQTKRKGWRKPKLSLRDERLIIRSLHYARRQNGNSSVYSGVSSVHNRTAECRTNMDIIIDRLDVRKCEQKAAWNCVLNLEKISKSIMTMGCGRLEYAFI